MARVTPPREPGQGARLQFRPGPRPRLQQQKLKAHGLTDDVPDQRHEVMHDDVQVGRSRVEHLLAAEDEEPPGQIGRKDGRGADEIEVAEVRVVGGHPSEQDLGAALDHREEVVEIVRDAAGELAQSVHFLELHELISRVLEILEEVPEETESAGLVAA